jgi:hypothetical protein
MILLQYQELKILDHPSWDQLTLSVCITYEHLSSTLFAMVAVDGERNGNFRSTTDFADMFETDALWVNASAPNFDRLTKEFFDPKLVTFVKYIPLISHGIIYFNSTENASKELMRLRLAVPPDFKDVQVFVSYLPSLFFQEFYHFRLILP